MPVDHIKQSIEGVFGNYTKNPDQAMSADKPAIAVVEDGLRCRASGPNDWALISDMPKGIGGGGAAPRHPLYVGSVGRTALDAEFSPFGDAGFQARKVDRLALEASLGPQYRLPLEDARSEDDSI